MCTRGTCQVKRSWWNLRMHESSSTIRNVPTRTTTLPEDSRPLKLLREAIGLTQDVAAENAGVDRTYYNRLETGRLQATTVNARSVLSKALGLSTDTVNEYLEWPISQQRSRAQEVAARSSFGSRKGKPTSRTSTGALSSAGASEKAITLVPLHGGRAKAAKRRGQ